MHKNYKEVHSDEVYIITGAMCIFRFDGENTDAKWIYDEERVKRIIKEITLTYSEGNWLVQDGTVYSASYDMARLYDQIEEKEDTLSRSGIAMPNASILSRHSIKYYRNTDADQVNKNIELSLLGIEENIVTIRLKNITDEECTYGLRFSLQKEIDGKWFEVPVAVPASFISVACVLPAGKTVEEQCNLAMYGELESGHYRIEKENAYAEFDID